MKDLEIAKELDQIAAEKKALSERESLLRGLIERSLNGSIEREIGQGLRFVKQVSAIKKIYSKNELLRLFDEDTVLKVSLPDTKLVDNLLLDAEKDTVKHLKESMVVMGSKVSYRVMNIKKATTNSEREDELLDIISGGNDE